MRTIYHCLNEKKITNLLEFEDFNIPHMVSASNCLLVVWWTLKVACDIGGGRTDA